jgi:hypothetical protein
MKKKHHTKKKAHRNNGSGGAGGGGASHPRPRPRPRPRSLASRLPRLPKRAPPPDWKTVGAAIAGGAGGAVIGGLVVNQKILSPEAVGLGLALGGGATAYLADGVTRVVAMGAASAGAGQLALALMAKQAVKSAANHNAPQGAQPQSGQPAAQMPAPPPAVEPPSRRSATGGGVVLDLFRDAATDLDMFDDEWRFGMRDDPRDASEPFVIDIDEAA